MLVASAFFAASEAALLSAREAKLRQAENGTGWLSRLAVKLVHLRSLVLAVILVGITASNYSAERLATHFALRFHSVWAPTATAIIMTVIVVVFCDSIPLQLGARAPEGVLKAASPVIAMVGVVLAPAVAVLMAVARVVLWLMGVRGPTMKPAVDEEELRAMIDVGTQQGALEEPERRMLHRILDFGDLTAGEVMTPRTDLVAVDESATVIEALRLGLETGHSRIPVYSETIDDVIGILHLKDCLPYLREGQTDIKAAAIARPALFVPENLPADRLLQQLQQAGRTAAIVKDEFGGTAGMVTMEDLLEEIVGDIQDEYDTAEEPDVVQVGPDEWVCSGNVNIPTLEVAIDATLPEGPWDTVSGLIMHHLEHVPTVGEKVRVDGVEFEVAEMDGTRVELVRVRRLRPGSATHTEKDTEGGGVDR